MGYLQEAVAKLEEKMCQGLAVRLRDENAAPSYVSSIFQRRGTERGVVAILGKLLLDAAIL